MTSMEKENKDDKVPSNCVIRLFSEMYSPMGIMNDVLKPKAKQFCVDQGFSYKDMVKRSSLFYQGLSNADQSHARLRHVFTVERAKCVLSGIPFRWSDQQGYSIHTGSVCRSCVLCLIFLSVYV